MKQVEVNDESGYLQLGLSENYDFTEIALGEMRPSKHNQWPLDYKFSSIFFFPDYSIKVIDR